MTYEDTIAAIATSVGQGGISVIRISGPDAFLIASKVFRPISKNKDVLEIKGYTALLGHIVSDDGTVVDEGLLLAFRAPKSYTGENVIELQCHGGHLLPTSILRTVIEAGARPASAGEFTKRAFINGRLSLDKAEAVMNLISSTSKQSASEAAKLLDGAMFKKLAPLKEGLTHIMADISAVIEFPDEGLEDLDYDHINEVLKKTENSLQSLIDSYNTGSIIFRGVPAAIVGKPNVGKSTILNLLAGKERAIVTPIAGTTRDIIEQHVELDGITLIISDTAGIHETADPVEKVGVELAKKELKNTSLAIAVFDSSLPISEEDISLAKSINGKPSVAVINKTDSGNVFNADQISGYFSDIIYVSALDSNTTLKALTETIKKVLNVTSTSSDEPLLANERQLSCTIRAVNATREAGLSLRNGVTPDAVHFVIGEALDALMELTGENVADSIIDDVFSRFCVGK